MDEDKFKAYVGIKLDADFKTYVATKLATDPKFAEKYSKTDAQGNKVITFTPEMFASVSIKEFDNCRCSCAPIVHGWGSCEDRNKGYVCNEQAGA